MRGRKGRREGGKKRKEGKSIRISEKRIYFQWKGTNLRKEKRAVSLNKVSILNICVSKEQEILK